MTCSGEGERIPGGGGGGGGPPSPLKKTPPPPRPRAAAGERLPAPPAHYADLPGGLDPALAAGLRARDLLPLYTHQVAAVEAALAGDKVTVGAGTGSGKTVCYHLPVLA